MNRRLRLLVGAVVAVVIAGALVVPVVVTSGGGSGRCSATLVYLGHSYAARPVDGAVVQDLSIGVGTTRGCGAKPENVNVRSLAGVEPAAAVGLEGVPSAVYVRRGVCPASDPRALWACLTR